MSFVVKKVLSKQKSTVHSPPCEPARVAQAPGSGADDSSSGEPNRRQC